MLDGDTNNNHIGSGSADQSNTIAFNAGPGVEILQSQGNFIRANSIFANGGLGIDLAGAAANNLQTSPVLTQAVANVQAITVTTISLSTPTSRPGDAVTFTATVTGMGSTLPTGSVTFCPA